MPWLRSKPKVSNEPSTSNDPPPSYEEAVLRKNSAKSVYGAVGDGQQQHQGKNSHFASKLKRGRGCYPGPSWMYHFPQQSAFNSPYSSLQYEEIGNQLSRSNKMKVFNVVCLCKTSCEASLPCRLHRKYILFYSILR